MAWNIIGTKLHLPDSKWEGRGVGGGGGGKLWYSPDEVVSCFPGHKVVDIDGILLSNPVNPVLSLHKDLVSRGVHKHGSWSMVTVAFII